MNPVNHKSWTNCVPDQSSMDGIMKLMNHNSWLMVCQTDVWIDTPLKSHSIQKLCTFGKIHTWGDAHKPQSQNPSPKPKPWPLLQTNDDTMKQKMATQQTKAKHQCDVVYGRTNKCV